MAPPLTPEEFTQAVAKGQGRAVLALQSGDPAPYRDALVAACVENLQFDRQMEANRADYLMRLVDLAGLRERVLTTILQTLPSAEEGWDRDLMIDLLGEFAKAGDARAWNTLRDLAVGDERAQNNLADTGEAGLAWVEANVLPNLPFQDRWRISLWLPDEETDDATPTQRRLRAVLAADYADQKAERKTRTEPKVTARAFFRFLDHPKTPYVSPHAFARVATRRELRKAAERLLRAKSHRSAWRLAQVFREREVPLPLRRLFAQATHEARGMAVGRVLGETNDPQVRRFALRLMRKHPLPWNAIEVLTASFQPSDEAAVADVLPAAAAYEDDHRHNVVLDLTGLFDAHPEAAWQPHAEWVYEHSPCSFCRSSAIRWMAEHGTLPVRVREEAPYDAESDIQEVVAEAASAL